MRLFVGIDVPSTLAGELARALPAPFAGLRPVLPEDMHLTLHFLGAIEPTTVEAALAEVRCSAFVVEVGGFGIFRFRDGRRVLWAGIVESAALAALHDATGSALAGIGFRPDTRPYRPHLTLARIDRKGRRIRLERFVASPDDRPLGRFEVREFVLYDSAPAGGPRRYVRLGSFPLDS